jgi:hypothetical protein
MNIQKHLTGVCRKEYSESPKRRAKCTSIRPQWTQPIGPCKPWRGPELEVTFWHCQILATATSTTSAHLHTLNWSCVQPIKKKTLSGPRPRVYWYVALTASSKSQWLLCVPHAWTLKNSVPCLQSPFASYKRHIQQMQFLYYDVRQHFNTLFMQAICCKWLLQNVSEQAGDLGTYVQE